MHESALVRDLMKRVETEVEGKPEHITTLRFRVGALSGISPGSLREGASHYARENWGYEPEVEIEQAVDPADSTALGVVLVSIGLRV